MVPEKDIEYRMTKNGRKQAVGRCPDCGGKVYKFVSK